MRCRRERGGRALCQLIKQSKGLVRTWRVLQLVVHAKWPPRGKQMIFCRVCEPSVPKRDTPRRTFEPQRPLAVAPRAFLGPTFTCMQATTTFWECEGIFGGNTPSSRRLSVKRARNRQTNANPGRREGSIDSEPVCLSSAQVLQLCWDSATPAFLP
jgi:hypothetical protein